MWLVLHIPKTAGTSLRWALDKYFGKSEVIRDYGPDAPATSDIVREYLYSGDESKGPGRLVSRISNDSKKVLIGHFQLKKYADFFETRNIMTFVRDPLVRMCSEYLHRKEHGKFSGSFSEFIQVPGYQNVQLGYLDSVSERVFVGITEHYDESLRYVNHATGWNLVNLKRNVRQNGGGRKFAENLSVHELELFYRMNAADMDMYKSVTRQFDALEKPDVKGKSFFQMD
jgi:hypothetical protein